MKYFWLYNTGIVREDYMSQVLVWKSDADGKLFEDKDKYVKHLRKLAYGRRQLKSLELHRINRELFLDRMGQVASFGELQQFIIDNWEFFRTNAIEQNAWTKRRYSKKDDQLISLELSGLHFVQELSNSHSCPRKGVTNFDRRSECNKGKPTSYPGWRGRITYGVTKSISFGSDYFRGTPICTGSGGGGDTHLSYDLSLWAADFPVMWAEQAKVNWVEEENRNRQTAWRTLGGNSNQVELVTEVPLEWTVPDALIGNIKER
jgi:hypothetical protein